MSRKAGSARRRGVARVRQVAELDPDGRHLGEPEQVPRARVRAAVDQAGAGDDLALHQRRRAAGRADRGRRGGRPSRRSRTPAPAGRVRRRSGRRGRRRRRPARRARPARARSGLCLAAAGQHGGHAGGGRADPRAGGPGRARRRPRRGRCRCTPGRRRRDRGRARRPCRPGSSRSTRRRLLAQRPRVAAGDGAARRASARSVPGRSAVRAQADAALQLAQPRSVSGPNTPSTRPVKTPRRSSWRCSATTSSPHVQVPGRASRIRSPSRHRAASSARAVSGPTMPSAVRPALLLEAARTACSRPSSKQPRRPAAVRVAAVPEAGELARTAEHPRTAVTGRSSHVVTASALHGRGRRAASALAHGTGGAQPMKSASSRTQDRLRHGALIDLTSSPPEYTFRVGIDTMP